MNSNKMLSTITVIFSGILMLAFQNCGKLNMSGIVVSDLSQKASTPMDTVTAQVTENNGQVIDVGTNPILVDGSQSSTPVINSTSEPPRNQMDSSSNNSTSNGNSNNNNQNPKVDTATEDPSIPVVIIDHPSNDELGQKSCHDYINKKGATVIDLASFGQVDKIEAIKGFTVIISSNANQYVENLQINRAVGRTIICGVTIKRLELKSGRLELLEGAKILSLGSSKGRIFADESSSIVEAE